MLPSSHVWRCNPWCLVYIGILWVIMWLSWYYMGNEEVYYVPYIAASVGVVFMLIYRQKLYPSNNNTNADPYLVFMCFDAFGTFSTATWGALLLNYDTYGMDSLGLMLPISIVLGIKSYASISWMQEVMNVCIHIAYYLIINLKYP